jgi:putative ABC transport system permease protein
MLADLRFALRLLAKSPGFAAVTLLTLALCIGANTAIFSAVYALMLKPLPFPEPDAHRRNLQRLPEGRAPQDVEQCGRISRLQGAHDVLLRLRPVDGGAHDVRRGHRDRALWGARATTDLFNVLGVKPLIGQFFTLENSRPNADKVVVLTQSFWTTQVSRRSGRARPDHAARRRNRDHCRGRAAGVRVVRRPGAFRAALRVGSHEGKSAIPALELRPVVRALKPGAALGPALAEGDTLEHQFYDSAPPPLRAFIDRSGAHIQMGQVQTERVQPLKSTLLMLQGGAIFVLLIGCVNIANLLLARANGRQSELAIRFALGATRGLIARQLLLETLLLTTLGTGLGLGLAWSAVFAMNHYRALMMPDGAAVHARWPGARLHHRDLGGRGAAHQRGADRAHPPRESDATGPPQLARRVGQRRRACAQQRPDHRPGRLHAHAPHRRRPADPQLS